MSSKRRAPKWKVGDVVWYLHDGHEIVQTTVREVSVYPAMCCEDWVNLITVTGRTRNVRDGELYKSLPALLDANDFPPIPKAIAAATTPKKKVRFIPPTLVAILEESANIGLSRFEAEKFFHFYTSKGWKVGKTTMKNWKSALRGWKSRNTDQSPTQKSNSSL